MKMKIKVKGKVKKNVVEENYY